MKAFVLEYGELKLKDMPNPKPKENEIVVKLKTAGLNRRDLYIPNRMGSDKEALVLGSDGAGIVETVGEGVTRFQPGDEVIINPSLNWYENSDAPPTGFDILGMPDHGTFAEQIVIHEEQLEKKPEYLSWEEAGSLTLAALTGYRALVTKGQIKAGETVFIPGASSGVNTFIIQFAKSMGARVIATSRSEDKQKQALEIGADKAISTDSDWSEALKEEEIDLVIDSVGAATFNRSLSVLKQGGRMVIYGATTEDEVDINLRQFFYGQYKLFGSTMGSREELHELLELMEKHEIRPVIDKVFNLQDAKQAFDHLNVNSQFGKVVLSIEA
ncbi:zinc-binding dehydrogenase [Oceanobacillus luteolus]|uniref:Zinc-binding dehydrogenase n=1 Tax=Oceanobacillus luteolus TaxID=1274358 RepID=A0ABW4HSR9_9BACI|nr:zinc-binding dehydrogenase [Oceanobacillus luteolus]MCM3739855.1 zinc-binding dehydrogenase [Oceanobacillus luteolus]